MIQSMVLVCNFNTFSPFFFFFFLLDECLGLALERVFALKEAP